MKFEKLYEICTQKKDEVRFKGNENKISKVLEQLILCCFNNNKNRYELPKTFSLNLIMFNLNEIKSFLEELLNVKVIEIKLTKNDYLRGNSFLITIE